MKKLRNIFLVILLVFGCFGISRNVYAETILRDRTTTVGGHHDKTIFSFKYDGYTVYYVEIEIKPKYSSYNASASDKDITFALFGDGAYNVKFNIGKNSGGYIYAGGADDNLKLNKTYKFFVRNRTFFDYKVNYKVIEYQGMAENIKLPSQMSLKRDTVKRVIPKTVFPYGSFPAIKWKSQNKSIVEIDSLGNIWGKKPGVTYVIATLDNGRQSKCKVTVTGRTPQMNYKKFIMVTQTTLKAELFYADGNVKWSSSNPQIATVSSKGTIKAKSIGECTITARYKKVNYTAKVVVEREYPNYYARLIQYNTRDNYFVVNFNNKSGKPITIYPSNAKVEHTAYRVYDRYLSLASGNAIIIPAGASQNVIFYVQGDLTWYDRTRYTLFYQMGFDGSQYEAHVWWSDSVYKRGEKWYYTEQR